MCFFLQVSGREMFMFNPALVDASHDGGDEDGDGDTFDMTALGREKGEDEEEQIQVSSVLY